MEGLLLFPSRRTAQGDLRQLKGVIRRRVRIGLLALLFAGLAVAQEIQPVEPDDAPITEDPISLNCTPPSILDFPSDLFTQSERRRGWVSLHFIASAYAFYLLAVVCDVYFVPSIENLCSALHLPSDVGGATFMAIATSSPELFTNVIGTFITKGDIGVGTIVGSAVFNILGVSGVVGVAAATPLPLEWFPLTRDCSFYAVSVLLLVLVLNNRAVLWYEALVLIIFYGIYIIVLANNTKVRAGAEGLAKYLQAKWGKDKDEDDFFEKKQKRKSQRSRRVSFVQELSFSTEQRQPLLNSGRRSLEASLEVPNDTDDISAEALDTLLLTHALEKAQEEEQGEEEWSLTSLPEGTDLLTLIGWVVSYPGRVALTFTIPDCRGETPSIYPLTFAMCIVWIAGLSYIVSWMMTIIGHTLGIPDSVMGLTFLAAGTSVPEAVSSLIVAKQGLGTMSISNSIGSNTFDILVCLGVPWLIQGSLLAVSAASGSGGSSSESFIRINSGGLEYSAMFLGVSLVGLYGMLAFNNFYLDRKVGIAALTLYGVFLIVASMLELNVFFPLNPPTCPVYS